MTRRGDEFSEKPSTALLDLCRELHHMKQQAEALGLFVDDRELLTCPQCGLQEDVQADGRLVTIWKDSQDFKDTGLRFVDMGDGRFSCTRCQTLVEATFLCSVQASRVFAFRDRDGERVIAPK